MATETRQNGGLLAYVASPHFLVHGTNVARYLAVLGFLYHHHERDFEAVLQMRGRRRVYFGRSPEEIEAVSVHTFPQPIDGSPFWALTNLNLRQKRTVLGRLLSALGYSDKVERVVLASLTEGMVQRTRGIQ